jgi:hypothetical protein
VIGRFDRASARLVRCIDDDPVLARLAPGAALDLHGSARA